MTREGWRSWACAVAWSVAATALWFGCGRVREIDGARDRDGGPTGPRSTDAGSFGCDSALADVPLGRRVSFIDDVLPIFGRSCAVHTSCHERGPRTPELFLGLRCREYDQCAYVDHRREPAELTPGIAQEVYDTLVGVPSTTAPAVARVAPGDPEASFLAHKIAGTHRDQGFACQPLEGASGGSPCGDSMPSAGGGPLCDKSPELFETIIRWIAQGADYSPCKPDDAECRSLGGACCDGATCVDLRTEEACGACGNRCIGGQICVDGDCTCPEGMLWCGGTCVQSDAENCGVCGLACRQSEECIDGTCACPYDGIFCDGLCRVYDENHCGACGVVCPPGTECDPTSFECECPSPLTLCGGQCVDTREDVAHCGGCDQPCPSTQSCFNRECVEMTTTCGSESCSAEILLGVTLLPACCLPDGGCGLLAADRFGNFYPDRLPTCAPPYTPGSDDASCPSDDPLFAPCCSEGGTCGLWIASVHDFGCVEALDATPCTPPAP